jgi:superfamily II DNA helicase RecQ
MIHEHLESQGVRSGLYHGGLRDPERDKVRLGFQPEQGDPTLDVVVATEAGESGMNLQRGKAVHHYDVPMTAKSHAQRTGRVYRQRQEGDVDVHNWYTDADYEHTRRRALKGKEGLAEVFESPVYNLDETGIAGSYARALSERHQGRMFA